MKWQGYFPPAPPRPGATDSDKLRYELLKQKHTRLQGEYWLWRRWYMRLYRWFGMKFLGVEVGVGEIYDGQVRP